MKPWGCCCVGPIAVFCSRDYLLILNSAFCVTSKADTEVNVMFESPVSVYVWSSRRSWCCSSCCCCLSWPVMLTACLSAADSRPAPVDSTCCCAAPAATPWGGRWPEMRPPASSRWASARRTRSAFRADSTSFSMDPGTRRLGSWRWARGLRRGLESRSWTGLLPQHPRLFNNSMPDDVAFTGLLSCWYSECIFTHLFYIFVNLMWANTIK